jgi:hypothetical protein
MPFTFAHPAIILPFNYCNKRYVSLTGLVAGSLVPDFEYFIRMRILSLYSHTIPGVFWFDLPLALILTFLFHNIVRNQLIINLPPFLIRRFQVYLNFDWNKRFLQSWFIVIISTLIGIGSHLLWDSFTHEHGFFAERLSFSKSIIGSIPAYKVLQHASSLAGVSIIAWSIMQLPSKNIYEKGKHPLFFWSSIFILTCAITVLRFIGNSSGMIVGNIVTTAIAAFLLALIIITYLSGRLIKTAIC